MNSTTAQKTITLSVTIPVKDLAKLTHVSPAVLLKYEKSLNEYWTGYFMYEGELATCEQYNDMFKQMVSETIHAEQLK